MLPTGSFQPNRKPPSPPVTGEPATRPTFRGAKPRPTSRYHLLHLETAEQVGTEFGREKLCHFQTEKLLQTRRSAPRAELAAKLSGSWIHKGFGDRDSCLSFRGGRRFLTEHSSERQTLIGEQPYGAEICLCQTSLAQIKCFSLKSASTLNPSACTGCFWCSGSTNRQKGSH